MVKRIHELEVVVSTLKAESEKYQQKYEYELTISTVRLSLGGVGQDSYSGEVTIKI